jgi:hypothetical protein
MKIREIGVISMFFGIFRKTSKFILAETTQKVYDACISVINIHIASAKSRKRR